MSKLTDTLRTVGVFNDHGFFNEKGRVWIDYTNDTGRGGRGRYAVVRQQGFKTDPDGPWYCYGDKAIRPDGYGSRPLRYKSDRAWYLAEAQKWAGERYGITEWARTPFGGYGEASFVKARLAELKALAVEPALKGGHRP